MMLLHNFYSSFRHCFTTANLPSKLKIKQQNGQSKDNWYKRTIIFTSSTPTTHHLPRHLHPKAKLDISFSHLYRLSRGLCVSDADKRCPNNGLFRIPVQNTVSDAAKRCPNDGLFRRPVQNPVSDAAKGCPNDGLIISWTRTEPCEWSS